ncbi:hypothetical protein QQM39_39920 [Streptomyces sp. DT2A-34]|uniref:hypothetical protein n=1 Tax=Streptomyces sp. DT2A-34 TaxID=3051182 RepID=UPI00265C1DF3|nr:hypothetical protein [Streptomyces sp. DT2A-34]MDO0916761.1 hypothetical protein [Streptomyces sp. DT2A-34]
MVMFERGSGLSELLLQLKARVPDPLPDQLVMKILISAPVGAGRDVQLDQERVQQAQTSGEHGADVRDLVEAAVRDTVARIGEGEQVLPADRDLVPEDTVGARMCLNQPNSLDFSDRRSGVSALSGGVEQGCRVHRFVRTTPCGNAGIRASCASLMPDPRCAILVC